MERGIWIRIVGVNFVPWSSRFSEVCDSVGANEVNVHEMQCEWIVTRNSDFSMLKFDSFREESTHLPSPELRQVRIYLHDNDCQVFDHLGHMYGFSWLVHMAYLADNYSILKGLNQGYIMLSLCPVAQALHKKLGMWCGRLDCRGFQAFTTLTYYVRGRNWKADCRRSQSAPPRVIRKNFLMTGITCIKNPITNMGHMFDDRCYFHQKKWTILWSFHRTVRWSEKNITYFWLQVLSPEWPWVRDLPGVATLLWSCSQ